MSLSKICKGLFDGKMATDQRASSDIVIYCPELGMPVRIAWPFVDGHPVPPLFMGEFLIHKNIYWPCFCSDHTSSLFIPNSQSVSCRIINVVNTTAIAVCHYNPPHCQFFLNLTSLRETAVLKPTADSTLSMQDPFAVLMLAMLDKKPDDLEDSVWRHTPYYLPGYMGVSGIQHVQKTIFDTTLIAYLELPQTPEQKLLARLAAGEGIPEPETRHLFVACSQCGTIFIRGFAQGHCAGRDIVEEESVAAELLA